MNKKYEYIEVAVLLPVFNTFTYKIPEHLVNLVSPGMRVLVPFGKRRVTGYILKASLKPKKFKAKLIFDVLDDIPLFPKTMIQFFRWISDYYIHPLGDVIKTALPAGLNQHDVLMVAVTKKGKAQYTKSKLSPGESEIITILNNNNGAISLKALAKKSQNPSLNNLIRKMEKNSLVAKTYKLLKDTTKLKKEKFLTLSNSPSKKIILSKKRKQILKIVKDEIEISLTKLRKQVPTAPNLIKPLNEAGYIKTIEKQVFQDPLGDPVDPDTPPKLTEEQNKVVSLITCKIENGFQRYLLSGVTGSGKTEVYLRLVAKALEINKTALVLVPEISLISQTERRFRARFGNKIAVLHSALSSTERLDQWRQIMQNKVSVVIGARSSLFAPLENLGIIIVDEEHDTSYKQESGLRYNARDLSVVRAKMDDIPVILGSATPSIQSYNNACTNKFIELKLENRVNKNPLPKITLVDLKKNKGFTGFQRLISPLLSKSIRECLNKGEQALIFLNRRGFSTFPVCESCGEAIKCKFCELTMTFHKGLNEYRCHLCGFSFSTNIKCPDCKSSKIKPLGFGTEKIETMLLTLFPDARIARIDQDTTRKKGQLVSLLKKIKNRSVDIIVGTQMLAKGHDFPFITLVGIICADLSLNFPDFRSSERTFQLLAQVAGRAGRGEQKGKVIMQTYNADHFAIQASKNQDFIEFYQNEVPFRKALLYPPFAKIIQLKISGTDALKVKNHSLMLGSMLKTMLDSNEKIKNSVQVLGPIEAGIPKIATRFRWQILLKGINISILNKLVNSLIVQKEFKSEKHVSTVIDVDPYSML
ncbi:MAG: primosomal protein N' [Desulfobacteraceae bacterium]|nr:primosomal protein N' [Desulfobacteraceae bacterium]